jgi:hypothetical protein
MRPGDAKTFTSIAREKHFLLAADGEKGLTRDLT